MARIMLLVGNGVALLGAWFGGISIGDVLLVLAFELIVSLYLLWPLVLAHRDATRLRGHFGCIEAKFSFRT